MIADYAIRRRTIRWGLNGLVPRDSWRWLVLPARCCRSACRVIDEPGYRGGGLGLRVSLALAEE